MSSRLRFWLFWGATLLLVPGLGRAQAEIDLASVTADPIKLIFSDERTTVASHLYRTLEAQTVCCGSDAIYLEVKISAEGKTDAVRALTGRNECLKRSVADLLRDIRWTKANLGTGKTIYFELKPVLPCRGTPGENVYKPVGTNARALAEAAAAKAAEEKALAPAQPAPAPVVSPAPQPVAAATPKPEPTPVSTAPRPADKPAPKPKEQPAEKAVEKVVEKVAEKAPEPSTPKPTRAPKPAPEPAATPAAPATKAPAPAIDPGFAGSNLALAKPAYSPTERQPDPSHAQSHANTSGPLLAAPEYLDGEALQALFLKQELRKAGVCGLVHVLAELTVAPAGKDSAGKALPATVVDYRLFRSNSKLALEKLPAILQQLRYKPESVRFRQNIYLEFKADVDCGTNAPLTNLGNVRDYLVNPEKPK